MFQLSLLSTLAICLLITSSTPTLDHHQLELKQHYEHLAYIAEFKCHTPQPRVIPVHDLFEEHAHNKAYFPDITVLHRCEESTGCCISGHHCSPMQSNCVRLPFKVTFLVDVEHHKKGSWIMEYHELVNHTECHCAEPVQPPTATELYTQLENSDQL